MARGMLLFRPETRRKSNCARAHQVVDMYTGVSLDLNRQHWWRTHADLSGRQALDDNHRTATRWARPKNRCVSGRALIYFSRRC